MVCLPLDNVRRSIYLEPTAEMCVHRHGLATSGIADIYPPLPLYKYGTTHSSLISFLVHLLAFLPAAAKVPEDGVQTLETTTKTIPPHLSW